MPKEYTLELSPPAKRDLKRLPIAVQKDIVFTHLPAIERDPLSTSTPLVGAFRGLNRIFGGDTTFLNCSHRYILLVFQEIPHNGYKQI